MAKRKKMKLFGLNGWCTARFTSDYDSPFVVIGKSLMQHPSFTRLKASSRLMYITMALLCRGKDRFTFARAKERRYCKVAPKTAVDIKRELEDNGFISSHKRPHKETEFEFVSTWKGDDEIGTGKCYTDPWLSAHVNGKEETVLLVGVSLLESDQFGKLGYQAKMTYFAMAMEAGKDTHFRFPPAKAKLYGIAKSTLSRAEKELEAAQFIQRDPDALTTPGAYRFCFQWKHVATIRGKMINQRRTEIPIQF